jgi:hypothetical protein
MRIIDVCAAAGQRRETSLIWNGNGAGFSSCRFFSALGTVLPKGRGTFVVLQDRRIVLED